MGVPELPRSDSKSALAAIIVVALVAAGALLMAARAAPDECEKWNSELGKTALNVAYGREAATNFEDHPAAAHVRASVRETESEMHTLLAEQPDGCEMDSEVEEEVRWVTDLQPFHAPGARDLAQRLRRHDDSTPAPPSRQPGDAKDIQEWLGHSSYQVTMDTYGHLFPERQEAIANDLNEVFEEAIAASGTAHLLHAVEEAVT